MNDTYRTIFERTFLVGGLPKGVVPADRHLQIFDNHIENTRISVRKIRVPETNESVRILEQRFPVNNEGLSLKKISQIYLNEAEYHIFRKFEGREIRKNRYFCEIDKTQVEIDIYLGKLLGLHIAKVRFESEEEMKDFVNPDFAIEEISNMDFFLGDNLVEKDFSDIKKHILHI